VSLQRVFVTR